MRTPTEIAEAAERKQAHYRTMPVYFIQYGPDGYIKIGYTVNIRQRMETIQLHCPMPIRLLGWRLGGLEEEQRLHELFAGSLSHHEWFRPTADLLAYAATELNATEPPIVQTWPAAEHARRQAQPPKTGQEPPHVVRRAG